MPWPVLVVDDERTLARNIATYLGRHGCEARTAGSAAEALAALASFRPEIVLLDLRLPDADGIELLARIRAQAPGARVVIMTGYASYATAVLAIKAGAADYLPKPIVLADLPPFLERLRQGRPTDGGLPALAGLEAIQGRSAAIVALRERIARLLELERDAGRVAPSVLVVGETGTGKELVARALHQGSARAAAAMVELNCTALPAHLVEGELFGHVRGAFTDAKESKPGLIEAADGGTLLLDEIGDLDLAVQAKLLKVLEDRRVRRLGAVQDREVDLRVVAATHRPLEVLVREGGFRADLYFRLRGVELQVPPLRERGDDIALLARHFLADAARRWRRPGIELDPAALAALAAHPWPGNVRELRNVIEQAVVLGEGGAIGAEHLSLARLESGAPAGPAGGERYRLPDQGVQMDALERDVLRQALERAAWNVTAAARLLGVSRDTVRYRIQKHGLMRP